MHVRYEYLRPKIPLLAAGLCALIAAACSSGPDHIPAPSSGLAVPSAIQQELPDGWSRVQVRSGFIGRDGDDAMHGFTVDLPPGWSAGESWPSGGPGVRHRGWIAGPVGQGENFLPLLNYRMGGDFSSIKRRYDGDDEYSVDSAVIEDSTVIWYEPFPVTETSPNRIGAAFDRIPGAPKGIAAPVLEIFGNRSGFEDVEQFRRVLSSIRYAEMRDFPELPVPAVAPDETWAVDSGPPLTQDDRRLQFPPITLQLPPGWIIQTKRGADTLAGTISGDGIEIGYDYGVLHGAPLGPGDRPIILGSIPEHRFWEERIGGELFWFVQPVSPEPERNSITGMGNFKLPGAGGNVNRIGMFARELDGRQQEIALAVMRSVRNAAFERPG